MKTDRITDKHESAVKHLKPWTVVWRVLTVNAPLKALSFVFAASLWLYVSVGQSVLEVPKTAVLELRNLPPDLVRTSDVVSAIDLKLLGSSAQLRAVEPNTLSYELDMAQATPGRISFKIIDSRLKGLPPGVKVTEISPSEITIQFSERVNKELPVEIVLSGEPDPGFVVDEKVSDPKLVEVTGAIEEIAKMNAVQTEVIDLTGRKDSYRGNAALNLVGRHVEAVDVKDVAVLVRIIPDLIQRSFEDIPIVVVNAAYKWTVKPTRQTLRLKGPTPVLRDLDPTKLQLVVDAAGLEPGEHTLKPQVKSPDKSELVLLGADLPDVTLVLSKTKLKK